jgi:hypothetical protein
MVSTAQERLCPPDGADRRLGGRVISHALDKEKAPVTAGAFEDERIQNTHTLAPIR